MRIIVVYIGASLFSAAVIAYFAYMAWTHRQAMPRVAYALLAACGAGLLWVGGESLYLLSSTPQQAFFWNELSTFGSGLTPWFFIVLLLALDRRWERFLLQLAFFGLALHLALRGYVDLTLPRIPTALHLGGYAWWYMQVPSPTWLTILWFLLTIGLGAVGIVYFVHLYRPVWQYVARWQQILILGTFAVILGGAALNVLDIGTFQYLEIFPPFLWFSFVVLAWGILRLHFDVTPAFSADVVLQRLHEGVLVFDPRDRLVWWNPTAQRALQLKTQTHFGQIAPQILAPYPWLSDIYEQRNTEPRLVRWEQNGQAHIWEAYTVLLRDPRRAPLGWVLIFRDLTETERLREQLGQQRALLEHLLRVAQAILRAPLGENEVFRVAAQVGQEVTHASHFVLVLLNDKGHLRRLIVHGTDASTWSERLAEPLGTCLQKGLLAQTLAKRQTRYIPDAWATALWESDEPPLPWRSLFFVPLFYGKNALGVFVAAHPDPERFSFEHRRMLEGLAEMLVLGLQHARLYAAQQQLAEEQLRAKEHEEWLRRREERFLANVSHEMRTPLQAMLGYLELIATSYGPDAPLAQIQADLAEVEAAARMLLRLINQLLDFQQAKSKAETLHIETFTWEAVLQDLLPLVHPLVERNQNELQVDVPPHLTMTSDRNKLIHILLNLLSNAAKFTSQGQIYLKVRAKTRAAIPGIEIRVIDTGIGIPEEAREAIFAPFVQASREITRRYGGTGLGLALVQHYVERLRGTIAVESEEGRGSTFIVWLPQKLHAPSGDQNPDA